MRNRKRDDAMRKQELEHIKETLARDGGNTLKRYVDKGLKKELCVPAPRQPRHSRKTYSGPVAPRWDDYQQGFMHYHCNYHNDIPHPNKLETKCLNINCAHLTLQKKSEITVKTLGEARDLQKKHSNLQIEQMRSGYRVTKT